MPSEASTGQALDTVIERLIDSSLTALSAEIGYIVPLKSMLQLQQ